MRSAVNFNSYYEVVPDLISIVHLQAGNMIGLGGQEVRLLDDFKMGPNLVRGFSPAGLGPRDTTPGTAGDAIGGTNYWGASLEFQYPFYFLPKDFGFRGAVFFDAGSVWGYKGETTFAATGEINGHVINSTGWFLRLPVRHAIRRLAVRAHVGGRQHHLGFAVRSAAVRFCLSDCEDELRPHPILRLRRRNALLSVA